MLRLLIAPVVIMVSLHPVRADEEKEALWEAARKGQLDTVKTLLAKGVDVNAKTAYGATALSYAAEKGHAEVVKLLLEHKAAVNVKDRFYNSTPLAWAMYRNHWDIIKALVEAGAEGASGVLSPAARAGKIDVVRAILDKNKITETTLSAALKATPAEHTEIAEVLRKAGAKEPTKSETPATKPADSSAKTEAVIPQAELDDDKPTPVTEPKDWPSFRGSNASGVADGQYPPATWDLATGRNVRWKTPIPGLGHSCPVVWGNRVFLTTAVSEDPKSPKLRTGQYGDVDSVNDSSAHTWRVLCIDKATGKILWDEAAHQGVPKVKRHLKSTHANSTPATDGKHVVACFGSEGLYCYNVDGKLLWKRDLGNLDAGWFYDPEYQWGFGSSPILYQNLVFVQCDVGKNSFLAAYDLADGKPVWQTPRDEIPSWGTPTIVEGPNRVELVANATKFVRGYDPLTGKELWRLSKNSEITVPTPVVAHGLIFVTSGYRPVQPIWAIRPGGEGDISPKEGSESSEFVAWSKSRGGPYMPTPIVVGEYLYACGNGGMLTCYEARTGKQVYQQRMGGKGGYTASPVAADGKLYFASEEGEVRVVRTGEKYELLALNRLDDVCMSTPAIADGMIFIRTQSALVGIGRSAPSK